ncbi:MAG: phosphotriesterase-related protein [Chloroflexota bacterium]
MPAAAQIMTVTGPIVPDRLGVTSIHEHLLFDLSAYWVAPPRAEDLAVAEAPLAMDNLWWARLHPMWSRANLAQRDPVLAAHEAARFKAAGGGTIVEVSSHGLARDVLGLRQVAERTGLNIIAGCGYYIGASHPPSLSERSVEQVTEELIREATEGIDGTGIRAGVIGEIGTSEPIAPNEVKVLRAAARAQRATGLGIVAHPAPQHRSAADIGRWLDVLEAEGADPGRVVISHLDERLREAPGDYAVLARRGYLLDFDTWGNELYYETRGFQMPSDGERVKTLLPLLEAGLADHLLLAQDVCFRVQLTSFGGAGYDHVLDRVCPRLRVLGVAESELRQMLVDNPRRALAGA